MRSWAYSALYALLYLQSVYVATVTGSAATEVRNLEFGIRNGRGWFRFEVDCIGVIEEADLVHAPHLFPQPYTRKSSHRSRTYQTTSSSHGATLTIHSDQAASIMFLGSDHVVEIIPRHLYHVGESGRALAEGVAHVATLENTTKGPWDDEHTCGAYVVQRDPHDSLSAARKTPFHMGKIGPSGTRQKPGTKPLDVGRNRGGRGRKGGAMKRRQELALEDEEVKGLLGEGRGLRAKSWINCYPGQNVPRLMDVGIIADYGFFTSYGSDLSATMDAIEVIVANTNLVYHYQFNIYLRARQVIIVDEPVSGGSCSPASTPTFAEVLEQDPDSGTCCHDIGVTLEIMANFSANGTTLIDPDAAGTPIPQKYVEVEDDSVVKLKLAHWHFLSNCYSDSSCATEGSCVVGLGFINDLFPRTTLCSGTQGTNTAVSFRRPQTWLVFAHELGHNVGSPHTFEEGIGSTGGIMDYGDGKYLGEYQFNEKYRRNDLCAELNFLFVSSRCVAGTFSLFPTYSAEICSGREDNFPCPIGVCLDQVCTPLETQLRVQASGLSQAFRVEIAEFGPISPQQSPIIAPLEVSTSTGCGVNPFSADFAGKIVVIERSGCPPDVVAANAQAIGALAVVITNDQDGSADPLPGDGHSIPTVMIARLDGVALKQTIERSSNVTGFLGGLPASDLALFTTAFRLTDFQLLLAALCAIPVVGAAYGAMRIRHMLKRREKAEPLATTGVVFGRPPTILDAETRSGGSEDTPQEQAMSAAESFAQWLRRSTFGLN